MSFGLVKYNNNSISAVTSAQNVGSGDMVLIKTLTASSSANLSFVHGSSDVVLDDTYPIYIFKMINIHPATNDVNFRVNFSTDSGSSYNVTKTSTVFVAYHQEDGGDAALLYSTGRDLAQSGSVQKLVNNLGGDNDQCASGELILFNPYSNEFVKNFLAEMTYTESSDQAWRSNVSGYNNTTSAINAVQFTMSSGNIESGDIKLYGIKDS